MRWINIVLTKLDKPWLLDSMNEESSSTKAFLVQELIYDGMLDIRISKETTLISFADDLVVVVVAKHPEDVAVYTGY